METPVLSQRAMLILKEGPGVDVERWPIVSVCTTIGRWDGNDVSLPDREVSRKHAQIRHEGGRFVVVDLGSKNGTHVNGRPIGGATELRDGDEIAVPPKYRFLFVDSDATVPAVGGGRGVLIDRASRQVTVDGRIIDPPLAPNQFALLELLASYPGKVFDRDAIASTCYPDADTGISDQAIDGIVRRLRARLGESGPERIEAIRGHGFRLTV